MWEIIKLYKGYVDRKSVGIWYAMHLFLFSQKDGIMRGKGFKNYSVEIEKNLLLRVN